jgi:hypothetical protein
MAIEKNLSSLPTRKESEEKALSYSRILVEQWAKLAKERGELAHAVEGTSMRHSMAGKCARAVHYYISGTEITNPFDLPGYWSTGLGTAVHHWWQDALRELFPNAEIEKTVHLPDADSSGHVDAWLPDEKVALELKSINGYGFKLMAEGGEGPKFDHLVQASVNAHALGAEKMVLIYLSLEAISKPRAKKYDLSEVERIAKEFHYTPDFFTKIAEEEIDRWGKIRKAGDKTPRNIPDPEYLPNHLVVDPRTGLMKKGDQVVGNAWQCIYCMFQDKCCEDLNGST